MSEQVDQVSLNGGIKQQHAHPFPGNVLMHVDGFDEADDSSCPTHADDEVRTIVTDLESAVVITSLAEPSPWGGPQLHRPVLDIDCPVTVVPSTTPGHHHLLIDKPLSWDEYAGLLDALAHARIVESGYVAASKRREHSAVRVPWLRKGDPLPLLPEERTKQRLADIESAAFDMLTLAGKSQEIATQRLRGLLGMSVADESVWP